MHDDRTTRNHLENRCLLNGKPYKDRRGRWCVRRRCSTECSINKKDEKVCKLTRQPAGEVIR